MMEGVERRKYTLFGFWALFSAAADQASKLWASDHLPSFGRAGMSVVGRKLIFLFAENPGIAFSQLQTIRGGRVVLSLISLVALALVGRYVHRTPPGRSARIVALGLICGGALGNVIDRVWRGRVIDFVLVDLGVWPLNPWPVFNVADAALVAGAILLAIAMARAPT